jgi:hypothetical protein
MNAALLGLFVTYCIGGTLVCWVGRNEESLPSNENPLHLVERHFLGSAVVELRRAGAGVVRHLRGLLKRPAVFEIRRHARRPKRMVAYLGRDLRAARAPLNHHVGIRLRQWITRELASRGAIGLEQQEQQRLRIALESHAIDISRK